MLDFMPVQGSSWAAEVDWINNFITYVSAFCVIAITGVMIYFAVKYRAGSTAKPTSNMSHNTLLETVWTVIPTIICGFVFWWGFASYKEFREPPTNANEISVTGKKWSWTFQHKSGKTDFGELVVPVGQPTRLVMTSTDVLHSFFIPSMRVKEDVIAGNYSYLWFTPVKTGEFPVFCTEYCGKEHWNMRATLKVVTPEAYQDYILARGNAEDQLPPAELGEKLYAKLGCKACHSIDGSRLVGPSFKGLYGADREFEDGTSEKADENYLKESILNSNKKIVKGYPAAMPAFEGQLNDSQIAGLIAFIKEQK